MTQTLRQQRHADMKAAILQAARAAILAHGPHDFSLREVARRSGYSPAGLYEYFAGKEDLVRAVANESLDQLYTFLDHASAERPPAERLIALGLAYVRFARENPEHFMLIFARLPSERTSLQVPPRSTSPYQLVLQAVQDGINAGVFVVRPGLGVEEIAYGVWVMAHGMAMLEQTHLQSFQSAALERNQRILEQFVDGLRA